MTPTDFIAKWKNGGDERRDSQPFFEDLCRLIGHEQRRVLGQAPASPSSRIAGHLVGLVCRTQRWPHRSHPAGLRLQGRHPAQAYEGHKKEVHQAGNEKLAAQLMEATIRNFGDNPIRLYDGKGMEGHPLESLKSLFADKDYVDKVLKLLEAIKPGSKP